MTKVFLYFLNIMIFLFWKTHTQEIINDNIIIYFSNFSG